MGDRDWPLEKVQDPTCKINKAKNEAGAGAQEVEPLANTRH
jgi:hypothetical protein